MGSVGLGNREQLAERREKSLSRRHGDTERYLGIKCCELIFAGDGWGEIQGAGFLGFAI